MKENALILFTRVPIPGQTKTRLMPFLSGEECAQLHICFLKDIKQKFEQMDADVLWFYTPEDEEKLLRQTLGEDVSLVPQRGEDLGERMRNAIGNALDMGYQKVILMGTDIPHVQIENVKESFEELDRNDIVIYPTDDGGYYLIGMKKNYESIWKIERYGTNTVIQDTLKHMEREGLKVAVGDRYYDVDEKEDLQRLFQEMKIERIHNCPITYRYLKNHLVVRLEDCNE